MRERERERRGVHQPWRGGRKVQKGGKVGKDGKWVDFCVPTSFANTSTPGHTPAVRRFTPFSSKCPASSFSSLSLSLSFSPTLFHLVHHYLRVLENCTRVRIVRTRAQLCHWSLSSVSVEYPIERVEVGTCNTVNHDSLCGPMCVDVTLCVVYTFLKFESSISLFFFVFFFFWQQILLGCIFLSRTFKTVSLEIYIYIWPRVLKDRTFVVNLIGLASD